MRTRKRIPGRIVSLLCLAGLLLGLGAPALHGSGAAGVPDHDQSACAVCKTLSQAWYFASGHDFSENLPGPAADFIVSAGHDLKISDPDLKGSDPRAPPRNL